MKSFLHDVQSFFVFTNFLICLFYFLGGLSFLGLDGEVQSEGADWLN